MSRPTIPVVVRQRVRGRSGNRCGYCLAPQGLVLGWLEIEHLIPVAECGTDDEGNLWLACRLCNNAKSDRTHARDPLTSLRVRLFDPSRLAEVSILFGARTEHEFLDKPHVGELPYLLSI